MKPTLLVLAAGMGSRYGGLKQLDGFGPSGETIMDYSVYDALRAGFGKVVFVIRREFEAAFRTAVGDKYAGRVAVEYVFQQLDDLPPGFTVPSGRTKPWGTTHAIWCARRAITEPFVSINADELDVTDRHALQLGVIRKVMKAETVPQQPEQSDPPKGRHKRRDMKAED